VRYGIGVASKEGIEHVHFDSPAFNLILSWKWIFTGTWWIVKHKNSLIETLESPYNWKLMEPWKWYEIPAGMPHGHKVIEWPIIFFFVQECGFNEIEWINENPCIGDFHRVGWDMSDIQKQLEENSL
jgi:hypothetical protein